MRRNPAKSSVAAVVLAALVVISVLLGKNVQTNRALAAKTHESETRRADAERSAAAERQRADEVLRLSDLQDVEDLVRLADELWPARPENIGRYQDWIQQARRLVEKLPAHRETLAQLRAHALPRTEEERCAERASHPEWASLQALEGELAFRRRALLERRDGVTAELPGVDWSQYPDPALQQNEVAWRMVDPVRTRFGDELLGLVLATRAFEWSICSQTVTLGSRISSADEAKWPSFRRAPRGAR